MDSERHRKIPALPGATLERTFCYEIFVGAGLFKDRFMVIFVTHTDSEV
jgi:hypothetical protein